MNPIGKSYEFIVTGHAIPKPRMSQRDKWEKRTVVENYRAWCDRIRAYMWQAMVKRMEKLQVSCTFFVAGHPHQDLDNLLKSILDAMNGYAFPDDNIAVIPRYGAMEAVLLCDTCELRLVYKAGPKKGQYKSDCGAIPKCKFEKTVIKLEELN